MSVKKSSGKRHKTILEFISPQTIAVFKSKINGEIKIEDFMGERRLYINKILQSGGLIKNIWEKGLKKIQEIAHPKKILIMGLGGGTLIKLVPKYFPDIEITVLEIDPEIIKIAEKYFDIKENSNLKILNTDAFKFKTKNKFDLVIADLFIGDNISLNSSSYEFLFYLKRMLNKNGILIFNRLFYKEKRKEAEIFINKLEKYFKEIFLVRAWSNLLTFAKK